MQKNTTKTEKIHNKVSCKRDQARPGQDRPGLAGRGRGRGKDRESAQYGQYIT